MLKKYRRLKSRYFFQKTLQAQRFGSVPAFSIFALPRHEAASIPLRFGFVVSKKVDKRAVYRNRIKRRLRELVRCWLLTVHPEVEAQWITMIFLVRPLAAQLSSAQLQEALKLCLKQQHVPPEGPS